MSSHAVTNVHNLDFLEQVSVPPETGSPSLSTITIIQPNSKYYSKEHADGFVIETYGEDPIFAEGVYVGMIDGGLLSRVLWAVDAEGRRDVTALGAEPVCASNNGVSARPTFWGKQIFDWRTKQTVGIAEMSCETCSLSKWLTVSGSEKKGAPPCQEVPQYVVFCFGYHPFRQRSGDEFVYAFFNRPAIIRARGQIVRAFFYGVGPQNRLVTSRAVPGPTRGINWYFSRHGNNPPPVIVDGRYHPLYIATQAIKNPSYNNSVNAPAFAVSDAPVDDESLDLYAQAVRAYNDTNMRARLAGTGSGEFSGEFGDTAETSEIPF